MVKLLCDFPYHELGSLRVGNMSESGFLYPYLILEVSVDSPYFNQSLLLSKFNEHFYKTHLTWMESKMAVDRTAVKERECE